MVFRNILVGEAGVGVVISIAAGFTLAILIISITIGVVLNNSTNVERSSIDVTSRTASSHNFRDNYVSKELSLSEVYTFIEEYNEGLYNTTFIVESMRESVNDDLTLTDFVNYIQKEHIIRAKANLLLNYGLDLQKEDALYALPTILSKIRYNYCMNYGQDSIEAGSYEAPFGCKGGPASYISYKYDNTLLTYNSDASVDSEVEISTLGEEIVEGTLDEQKLTNLIDTVTKGLDSNYTEE